MNGPREALGGATPSEVLILPSGLFLLGLLTDLLGRRTILPRAALLLLLGFVLGPSGAGWIDGIADRWFPFVSNVALVMIGFLLGGELTREALRAHGRSIVVVSIGKVIGSFVCVMLGLLAVGARYDVAMILAAASTATAPAGTVDVLRADGASGPFTRTLLGIVAVDDAWGLIIFGLALAVIESIAGAGVGGALSIAVHELGGALLLGLALGAPAALLELGGPVLTRLSLRRVGENGRIPPNPDTAGPPTEDRTPCES